MPNPFKNDAERDAFLSEPRLAILIAHRKDQAPIGVPVWFDWNGNEVQIFAAKDSPKTKRLRADPRASVLVTNRVDEYEKWVAFDGSFEIKEGEGIELAEKLAPHYWDLHDPLRKEMLDLWKSAPDAFCLLTMKPERIRVG